MEKNTGKFMKELWTLLLSAQNNISGVPQQFLDAKEEEQRKKKVSLLFFYCKVSILMLFSLSLSRSHTLTPPTHTRGICCCRRRMIELLKKFKKEKRELVEKLKEKCLLVWYVHKPTYAFFLFYPLFGEFVCLSSFC